MRAADGLLLLLLCPCVFSALSKMQAAKLVHGEAAWAAMSSQQKRAAVIAAQQTVQPADGPMLMLEGPAFVLEGNQLTINGRPILLDHDASCASDDHAVRTSHRVTVPFASSEFTQLRVMWRSQCFAQHLLGGCGGSDHRWSAALCTYCHSGSAQSLIHADCHTQSTQQESPCSCRCLSPDPLFWFQVWDCAVVLAKMLEHRPALVSHKRALELGAGQGIVGVAAAMLGAEVLVTDHPAALPSLRESVARNVAGAALEGELTAAALDWTDSEALKGLTVPYEVLLLADVVWVQELIIPLVAMMRKLSGPDTTVLFAYQSRSRLADETLFQALAQSQFEWEQVKEDRFHPDFRAPKISVLICLASGLQLFCDAKRLLNDRDEDNLL